MDKDVNITIDGIEAAEWGAPKEKVFIITLGNILEKSDDGQITK